MKQKKYGWLTLVRRSDFGGGKMFNKIKLGLLMSLICYAAAAQYIDTSGSNPAITEYERELQEMYPDSPEMLDRGIMYIFYDGNNCPDCADVIKLIYEIHAIDYEADYGIVEIDYSQDLGINFRGIYNLTQPLTVVLVKIHDGQAWGYQKIENLLNYADNPRQLRQIFMEQVNNFTEPQNFI